MLTLFSCVLDAESLIVCGSPPVGGVSNFVMLYNYTDWRAMDNGVNIVYDADGTISTLTNAATVQAFRFDQPDETALILGSPVLKNSLSSV